MFQAYHGHGDILRLLLPLFSNANIKDDTGKTPLDHASFKGTINLCPFVNEDWHKTCVCVFDLILFFLVYHWKSTPQTIHCLHHRDQPVNAVHVI